MAKKEQLNLRPKYRQTRYFSEGFKKKKVEELDKRVTSVAEICKAYEVSNTAVYKWIYKYSVMRKKAVKLVVESQSDTARIKAMQEHISLLEQMLGQKEFELDFVKKQMEIASAQYGVDFKKKPSGPPSTGTGSSGKSTDTK